MTLAALTATVFLQAAVAKAPNASLKPAATFASPAPPGEAYEGFDLALLAECWAWNSEYKTRYGDKQGPVEFEKYLQGRGRSSQAFWRAYAAWWERFKADPTGKLEAEFHARTAEHSNRLNFGDVPDASLMKKEGLTLEQYARISASMTRPGATLAEAFKANGVTDTAQWQRASAAWAQAMAQDKSMGLVLQYAELYKKAAGPAFAAEQLQRTADALAAHNREGQPTPGSSTSQPLDRSPGALATQLASADRNERWTAARWLGLACDEGRVNKKDKEMLGRCAAAVPVLLDILDHHEDDEATRAEDAASQLVSMVGGHTDEVRITLGRCLNRARTRLETLHLAFDPIRDKALPERITLQTKIQGYEALAASLDRDLKAWKN